MASPDKLVINLNQAGRTSFQETAASSNLMGRPFGGAVKIIRDLSKTHQLCVDVRPHHNMVTEGRIEPPDSVRGHGGDMRMGADER